MGFYGQSKRKLPIFRSFFGSITEQKRNECESPRIHKTLKFVNKLLRGSGFLPVHARALSARDTPRVYFVERANITAALGPFLRLVLHGNEMFQLFDFAKRSRNSFMGRIDGLIQ